MFVAERSSRASLNLAQWRDGGGLGRGRDMAKAIGVGGVFLKCADPPATAAWYREALGFEINDLFGSDFRHADAAQKWPRAAKVVWGLFDPDTAYFDPADSDFMINFMVDDLDGALMQVAAAGGELVGAPQDYDFGRFGWFIDPDGRKVELWQPAEPVD